MGPLTRENAQGNVLRDVLFAFLIALAVCGTGCGGVVSGLTSSPPPPAVSSLTPADVTALVQAAAQAADPNTMVIAVVDRAGRILGVYRKPAAATLATGNFGAQVDTNELAVSLARTAAFFSNDQAPLSSRTVRFISGIHFPPGVSNASNAALYGIENTNRGCTLSTNFIAGQAVPRARSIDDVTPGLGITTGKADMNDSDPNAVNPGGVPLFRNGSLVGGIGVAGVASDVAEFAAYAAATSNGFGPAPAAPGVVFIDGVALPFVNQTTRPASVGAGSFTGSFVFGPVASASPPPEGMLVKPAVGPVGGLSVSDVTQIIDNAIATANQTRAVIRLPIGSSARMAIAVADLDGTIIGLYRMADGTVFSIDVAASKARNMVYFNSVAGSTADLAAVPAGTVVTNRTIGFGAQPFYPPGIDGSTPGPFFDLYKHDVANPCTQGSEVVGPNLRSGIVFFPGSLPLYRNGALIGGLGISGDGVDQDDFVAAGGAAGFEAPMATRADQVIVRNVRLPYLKFPTNPTN